MAIVATPTVSESWVYPVGDDSKSEKVSAGSTKMSPVTVTLTYWVRAVPGTQVSVVASAV